MVDPKPGATLAFDLDGTLCTNTFGEYDRAEPHLRAIARVNRLARDGYRIVVFTARGSATGIDWDETTRGQLERWGVSYDELRFGKPSADVYIDDRAVHTESWLRADAFTAPGFPLSGEGLPPASAPDVTAICEVGRTVGGVALNLEAHAERAVAGARAAGLTGKTGAAEIADNVNARLAAVSLPAGDDLVYTLVISARAGTRIELGRPATLEDLGATLAIAVRPLSDFVEGGTLEIQGGAVALATQNRLLLPASASGPAVTIGWIETVARSAGIEVELDAVGDGEAAAAEEAMLIGMPQFVLPLQSAFGRRLPAGAPGPIASKLLAAVGEVAGLDPLAQLRELAR